MSGPRLLRLATLADVPRLERLIIASVHGLQATQYSKAQRSAALGSVFGVDTQLIRDGTYYVVGQDGAIVACGGWSRRGTLFGADARKAAGEDALLDPAVDAARIRAFFVDPPMARRGLGRQVLEACEQAIVAAGFRRAELVATLAGEPLYASAGFVPRKRFAIALGSGLELPVVRMTKKFAEP